MVPSAVLSRSGRLPLYTLTLANAISWHGSAVTQLAVPWFVLSSTGSPTLTGVVALCGLSGGLLSFLFGADLIDRLGYRRASILSDVLSALAVALLPLLALGGRLPFWEVAVLAFARALLEGPGSTARASLLPDLAREGGVPLEHANTLSEVAESGSGWTGPLLAGVLISTLGASRVLWIDATSFLVSAALIGWGVPRSARGREREAPDLLPRVDIDRWAGWRWLWRDGPLRVIFGSSVVFGALMAALFAVVLPVFARRTEDAVGLGTLVSAFGVGSVLGALLFGRFGGRWSRRTTFLASVWGLCGLFGGLALAPTLPVAVAVCFVGGLISGPNGPLIPTILQERTPAELRAWVFSASAVLTMLASPLGVLLGGVALDRLPFTAALLGMTALFAVAVVAATLDRGLHDLTTARGSTGG
ncbi:MFS transporter [Deinococcus apachensis]|uniref:MFS transporter n=1 Tax=Deinococcus apachensis TaxID=309886 RepID=UPI00037DD4D8|nr:MFS transporter [Deinococcus apachensis]